MSAPSTNWYLTDVVTTVETARDLVVVAVDADTESTEALRWAFDEAVMRGGELEVIQAICPVAPYDEMCRQQRLLSEMLADWRSDFPGLAVRIDVTRGDPTALLMEASAEAAVLVIAHPRTSGLLPSILSHDSSPTIAAGPVVLVRTAHSRDHGLDKVLLAV
jgi:nucleotide-binding universal stress UspA family protein